MKINIKSSISSQQNPLNLNRTRHSQALKKSQGLDLSYSSLADCKRVTLLAALTLGLLCKPYFAHAEENAVTANLQAIAEAHAQEIGDAHAEDHWTRIEFSTVYIDPVVVVEGSIANSDKSSVVGIRNVDARGFEISLKNCSNSTDAPAQKKVNYAVIEKSQLPSAEGANAGVRQQFSWGECITNS